MIIIIKQYFLHAINYYQQETNKLSFLLQCKDPAYPVNESKNENENEKWKNGAIYQGSNILKNN